MPNNGPNRFDNWAELCIKVRFDLSDDVKKVMEEFQKPLSGQPKVDAWKTGLNGEYLAEELPKIKEHIHAKLRREWFGVWGGPKLTDNQLAMPGRVDIECQVWHYNAPHHCVTIRAQYAWWGLQVGPTFEIGIKD